MLGHFVLVLHYLNETLDSILYERQRGFRKGLGCETRLCAKYRDLVKAIEKGSTVHGVILYFWKAFEEVPRNLLMEKIRRIDGINPTQTL